MLPKKNRVGTKEINEIFKKSTVFNSPSLTLKYLKNDNRGVKISFLTPKNVAKLAVKRNLLRRHGYSALGKNLELFPAGFMGVFIFKKYQDKISTLENEIKNILLKIN